MTIESPAEYSGGSAVRQGGEVMGFLKYAQPALLAKSQLLGRARPSLNSDNPMEGRARWREIFTNKEEPHRTQHAHAHVGGSAAQSNVNGNPALKRLIMALRSRAPGGWSDDRWEQTMRHYKGIPYIAINRIACHLSRAEFQVYQRDDNSDGGLRPVKKDDPPQGDRLCKPYDLVELLEKPNPLDSFGKLMFRWCQQKFLTGTALTMMVPNKLKYPMEIYSIPTAIAIPQATINPEFPEGYYRIQPIYPYGPFSTYPSPTATVGAAVDARWTFKFSFPHPLLRYEGFSPQTGLSLEIDTLDSIVRSRWYGMKGSVNPSGVLNMKEVEGMELYNDETIERLQALWEEFQGPEATGSLLIPPPGATLDNFGHAPVDMDYQQGFDQLASLTLGGFGITKPAAGMVEDASYSTLFATLKQLYMVTLEPECDEYAAELTRWLAPFFGDNLVIKIRAKPINDHEIAMTKVDKGMAAKCLTKNEVRKALDMPPTKEKWGDEIAGTEPQQAQQPMSGEMPGGMPGMPAPQEGEAPQGMELQAQQAEAPPAPAPGQETPDNEIDLDAEIDKLLDEEPTLEGGEGADEEEIERSRPKTGELGRGSRGPRKFLSYNKAFQPKPKSSYYWMVREACANGHS